MHRDMGRPSLVESLLPETLGHNERLERIRLGPVRPVVGKSPLRSGRETQLPSADDGQGVAAGAVPYNLSDPQMEEALQDRISFRRWVFRTIRPTIGTISRFRATLEDLGETLVQGAGGPTGRPGTGPEGRDVDGRHISKATCGGRPRRAAAPRVRPIPISWESASHLGVDAGTGRFRAEVADGLVSGDAYGDRAYESKRRRRWLKSPMTARSCTAPTSINGSSEASQRIDIAPTGVGGEGVRLHSSATGTAVSVPYLIS